MNKINGYNVLSMRFSPDSTGQHHLYVKENSNKGATIDKPKGKSLFVANVPPYATETSLKNAFKDAGKVKNVIFDGDSDTFRNCYIVFQQSESISKILKLETLRPLSTADCPVSTGISKWVKEYNDSITDDEKLRAKIKQIVTAYDKNEGKQTDNNEDDEGWTVVTKNSRNPGLSRKESLKNKLNDKMFKKKKELTNFYRFQIRESKKNHLANLRKKYEEDKKRVEAMKQARKFKPF